MVDKEPGLLTGEDKSRLISNTNSVIRALSRGLNGQNILPPPLTEYSTGMTAIVQTSERAREGFFDSLMSKYKPDGYIVGVGAGTIFTLVDCFSKGIEPKGIIIADANPQVIAFSQFMIETLRMDLTPEDFTRSFFKLTEDEYKKRLDRVIRRDRVIKKRIKDVPGGNIYFPNPMSTLSLRESDSAGIRKHEDDVDVIGSIMRNLRLLQRQARQDKIVTIYTDFVNPLFVDAVIKLPGFRDATNFIYLSNIAMFITSLGHKPEELKRLAALKRYEELPRPQVFIDAKHSGDLYLEASTSVPSYVKGNL